LVECDRIRHGQVNQHAGFGRVRQQHDALACGHGPALPVVRIAEHGHAIVACRDVDARELRLHGI